MTSKIKTRFAPSPTGYLHVGGLRTALYAYLVAKKNGGTFMLRIEDTDQKREVEGAVESLLKSLQFFDLQWDEGPYFQSKRLEIYAKYAEILLEKGAAYRCFCTPERLEKMREEQAAKKMSPKYDRHCLNLSETEKDALFQKGTPSVIRQLIPHEDLTFNDLIRGEVHFHGKDVDDQVLMKSDGFPTYHLANVVDDHEMEVSHVIRGEEWLPSTPKHVWLYQAFGWQAPEFAHLPLLLNPDKTKLSKRQGDVAAEDYIRKGYLKEAVLNFVAFLGWNPGTEEEFFTLEELVDRFDLSRVQKAGAVFTLEKLDWLNGHYLRKMSPKDLAEQILARLKERSWFNASQIEEETEFLRFVACVQSRMKTLEDGPDMLKPFLMEHLDYDLALFDRPQMKVDKVGSHLALEHSLIALEECEDFTSEESIKAALIKVIEKLGLKNGQVLWPVRAALSGEEFSPGAFEMAMILGKEKSLQRLKDALEFLA